MVGTKDYRIIEPKRNSTIAKLSGIWQVVQDRWIGQFYSYMQIDSKALKPVFKRGGFFNEMHVGVRGQIQDGARI